MVPHQEGQSEQPHDPHEEVPQVYQRAEDGDIESVKSILRRDPRKVDIPISESDPHRPLHLAAWQDHVEVVQSLLDFGADVDAQGEWHTTPLRYAAQYGSVRTAEVLLKHGADPNARDKDGRTPLDYALSYRRQEVAEVIASHAANVGVYAAMGLLRVDHVRTVIETDPDLVEALDNPEGLLAAAISMMRGILDERCPSDMIASSEARARRAAAASTVVAEHKDILESLVRRGAPRTIGHELLAQAVQTTDVELVEIMLEYGADTESRHPEPFDLLSLARNSPRADEMLAVLGRHNVVRKVVGPSTPVPDLSQHVAALHADEPIQRYMGAHALGILGPLAREAVPALLDSLNDPDARVRVEVLNALKRIDPEAADRAGVD